MTTPRRLMMQLLLAVGCCALAASAAGMLNRLVWTTFLTAQKLTLFRSHG
jgi:hypothetical protein